MKIVFSVHVPHRITLTKEEEKSYSTVMETFHRHFVLQVNIAYEQHRIFTRSQDPGETANQLVRDGSPHSGTHVRIWHLFRTVWHVVSPRLLRIHDLNLFKAVDTCRAVESSQDQLQAIE